MIRADMIEFVMIVLDMITLDMINSIVRKLYIFLSNNETLKYFCVRT